MAADENEDVDQQQSENQETNTETVKSTFTLEVLHLIKEAQQQHGLRHGDYQRYRSYCTRRLRRLRKSLNFLQGNKHRFVSKKVNEDILKDVKFLYLPLVTAERAWSYAMQLKQEANTEPRKRFHLISRLKKAATHSQELENICLSEKCDARTKLEAQAYNAWMQGTLQFELHQWKGALEKFRKAQTIYEKLASALVEEEQTLYKQRVEEFSPNIRYCEYNIGDKSAINDLKQMRLRSGEDILSADLDALISQTREKQSTTLSTVTWEGRTIAVKQEKVRVFLLNVQESENELSKTADLKSKISILDSLLMECKDSIQLLRDELRADPNFKSRVQSTNASSISSLQHLYNYVVYLRLSKTVDRNLLMIESLKQRLPNPDIKIPEGTKVTKPQDLIRLYETNLQNFNEIKQILEIDEDSELFHSIDCKILYNKSLRCFYIAQAFASIKKWTESLALYTRVEKYISDCKKDYKKYLTKEMNTELEDLLQQVDGNKYSLQAMSIINSQDDLFDDSNKPRKEKRSLVERLDEYCEVSADNVENICITKFPPDYKPIPCKPLFFDLALNHIEFPSLDDKLEQKKAGGLTGMVKGWLWGGKK